MKYFGFCSQTYCQWSTRRCYTNALIKQCCKSFGGFVFILLITKNATFLFAHVHCQWCMWRHCWILVLISLQEFDADQFAACLMCYCSKGDAMVTSTTQPRPGRWWGCGSQGHRLVATWSLPGCFRSGWKQGSSRRCPVAVHMFHCTLDKSTVKHQFGWLLFMTRNGSVTGTLFLAIIYWQITIFSGNKFV